MFRNSASRPEAGVPGRILAGLLFGSHQNRPALFFVLKRTGRPASGPEALCRNIEYLPPDPCFGEAPGRRIQLKTLGLRSLTPLLIGRTKGTPVEKSHSVAISTRDQLQPQKRG